MRRFTPRALVLMVAALLATARADAASAQGTAADVNAEMAAIREGGVLEARGDLPGAERVARALLEKNPRALTSLLTLERLLTMQGRVVEIEPYIDRLLAADRYSVIAHQMRVRMYGAVNRPADLERAGSEWIRTTPDVETPYREIARTWRLRGDTDKAIEVLALGRRTIGGTALALELGDALAERQQYQQAVMEWARAIGDDGQAFLPVQRRVQALPDGGAAAVPALIGALRGAPTTWQRRRAAAQIALDAGMPADAEQISKQVLREMPSVERVRFLTDIARRADSGSHDRVAYWAYGELLKIDTDTTRALAIRTRFAQLAMATGDTAKAAQLYEALERAAAPGSPQRRQALAARVQLLTRKGDVAQAVADLNMLRSEFPKAPELDEVASDAGRALLEAGDVDGAAAAVAGVAGARSGALRGRIHLRQGNLEKARDELMMSVPALRGSEATDAIALAALLSRLSKPGAELLARVLGSVAASDAGVRLLLDDSRALPAAERAALLDYGALLADRAAQSENSELLRREIAAEHGASAEAPAALLALSRTAARRKGGADDARLLLERLILDHPRSALVPQARHELDVLRGAVPGRM